MKQNEEWTEKPHPAWGMGGKEESVHDIIEKGMFPKTQWRKGKFSIIPPCGITFGKYELFPIGDSDVASFSSLKEAQDYADALPR